MEESGRIGALLICFNTAPLDPRAQRCEADYLNRYACMCVVATEPLMAWEGV